MRPAAGVASAAASTIRIASGTRNQPDWPKSVISLKVSTTAGGSVRTNVRLRASRNCIASATSAMPASPPSARRRHGGSNRLALKRRGRPSSAIQRGEVGADAAQRRAGSARLADAQAHCASER